MKLLSILTFFFLMNANYAGSFHCYLGVGFNQSQKLEQLSFAEDDPEEESEEYGLILESGVKAHVLYLPYQDGLYLSLQKGEVSANTNFDQESDGYANLDLKISGVKYRLFCKKK